MKWTSVGARCAVAAIIACASTAHADGIVTFTKNAAYSTFNNAIDTSFLPVASVIIAKGKKNRILEVEVTVTETTNTAATLSAFVNVNGVKMEPTGQDPTADNCGLAQPNCTLTAIFWADLDLYEQLTPGLFIGQPLGIDAHAAVGPVAGTAKISMRARLVKK